ncbi:MAG: carboxypeptidase-like regulatory domain-containing protein [Planctomycetota bacterium]
MRSPLLGLLVLVLLAMGVWVLMDTPEEGEVPETATEFVEQDSTAAKAVDASNGPEDVAATDASVERIETQPEVLDLPTTKAGDFHLVVVDSASLDAIAGAEVFLLRDFDTEGLWFFEENLPVVAAPLELAGENTLGPFFTDAKGAVWLPEPRTDDLIIARLEDSIGFRTKHVDLGWVEGMMKIYPDPTLELRAVDSGGQPVEEIDLALFTGSSTIYPRLIAKTDAMGVARFFTPRLYLRNSTVSTYHLGSLHYGAQPEIGPFPFTGIPRDAEVVIETKGSFRIRLENEDGTPYLGGAVVTVQARKSKPRTKSSVLVEEGDSSALVQGVEPEIDFRIYGTVERRQSAKRVEEVGPPAGQEQEVVLVFPGNPLTASFQCIDEEGQPFRDTDVRIVWWAEGAKRDYQRTYSGKTDAEGLLTARFLPSNRNDRSHDQESFSATIQIPETDRTLKGKTEFIKSLGQGESPHFTMTFEPEPVFAGGRVTDTEDQPVEGVSVYARQSNEGWPDDYGADKTDADGRFLIYSDFPESNAELTFNWNGQSQPPMPIDPGSLEHNLELQATPFEVRGTLLMPDFARGWHSLSFDQGGEPVRINLNQEQGIVEFVLPVPSDAPGRLVVGGRGRVEYGVLERVVPVLKGGEANPLLEPWDLRNTIGMAEVEVRIGSEPIDSFRLEVKIDNAGRESYKSLLAYTENGHRYMVPNGVSVDARLAGTDLTAMEVTLRPGKQVIQAIPATRGTFRLEGDGVLPDGYTLQLTGRRVESSRLERYFRRDGLPDWEAKFQLPGAWKAQLMLVLEDADGRSHRARLKIGPDGTKDHPFEVPENSTSFEVGLPLSADVLEKAIETLRQKTNS